MRDSVLRIVDRSTIGHMLVSGPFCLLGFCKGMRTPSPKSRGCPSSIAWLKMSASGAQTTYICRVLQKFTCNFIRTTSMVVVKAMEGIFDFKICDGIREGPLGMSSQVNA